MGGGHYMAAVKDGAISKRANGGGSGGGSGSGSGAETPLEAQSSHGSVTSIHSMSSGDDTPPANGTGAGTGVEDRWYLYNDHVVTKIDESEVCNEDAYLLFYMRRDMRGIGLDRYVYISLFPIPSFFYSFFSHISFCVSFSLFFSLPLPLNLRPVCTRCPSRW